VNPIGTLNNEDVNAEGAGVVAGVELGRLPAGDAVGLDGAGELGSPPTPPLPGASAYNAPPMRTTSTVAMTANRA
jgi:hypothetical protein